MQAARIKAVPGRVCGLAGMLARHRIQGMRIFFRI
jgi:hypothetical protein